MATAANVFIIGLCSFVNIQNSPSPDLPAPSVVCHRADAEFPHTALLAWEPSKVTLQDAEGLTENDAKNGFHYIILDGQRLTLNDDWSAPPDPQSSFNDGVPHLGVYSKAGNATLNHARIPRHGERPNANEVAAFMEFGSGKLFADSPTQVPYQFKDAASGDVSLGPKPFMRRVRYSYNAPSASIVFVIEPLAGGKERKLIFKQNAGKLLEVWLANVMNDMIPDELSLTPAAQPSEAKHFKFFYQSLANASIAKHIPVPVSTPNGQGSVGTGYCGPDSQP